MAITSYTQKKPLDSSVDDLIITTLDFENSRPKKLVSFCVIQVHSLGDQQYEIIKFDAAHGSCHAHRYYRDLHPPKEHLTDVEISHAGFEKCRKDVLDNWKTHKAAYVKKWLSGTS